MMKQPTDIDAIIARNLRTIRNARQLNLSDVSKQINVSYQQLRKYETCENRISAGKLWALSQIYGVPIERLFTDNFRYDD